MNNTILSYLGSVRNFLARIGPKGRGAIMLLVLVIVMGSAISPLFPRSVTRSTAPSEVFSGERAMAHLPTIAKEEHRPGSPAQALVRDYLAQQLKEAGLVVEIQQEPSLENVVARLYGTDPTGAILLQAHYDSIGGPGAADNGAGVAALLEVARALAAGPALLNDIIILFDDSEELPDDFTGTKAFIRKHPWMKDVRVAIGLDTAAGGFISTNDTGPNNGWIVHVLARAYTGGGWSSLSGGGNYDTLPFRRAGIRVLELEDNYPFYQQHSAGDVPEIVNPGTVQQLGEQALAVSREIGNLDLANTSGVQETYVYIPVLGLAHYPESWALPLVILGGVLLVLAIGISFWNKLASLKGFGIAILITLTTAALSAAGTNALWKAAPDIFGWETSRWPEWPEVIPPNGWLILILSNLVTILLITIAYGLTRRWSKQANFSLFGLIFLFALAIIMPKGAILFTWPVLIGSAAWLAAATLFRNSKQWPVEAASLLAAIPTAMLIAPLLVSIFMADGTKSVAITAGVWPIAMGILLPAVDGLFRPQEYNKE